MGKYDEGQFENQALQPASVVGQNTSGQNRVIKTGAGFLKSITLSQEDAAPTAGDITIYDGTSVYGVGDGVLFHHNQTTAVFMPVTIPLNVPFKNGLSVGGISDVRVSLSFK